MKIALFAGIALMGASAAVAQSSSYQPVPPGDGITRQGTNPEGQACAPQGYNIGIAAYPQCTAMGGPLPEGAGMEDYPPCTKQVKDRCRQTYTRWTR